MLILGLVNKPYLNKLGNRTHTLIGVVQHPFTGKMHLLSYNSIWQYKDKNCTNGHESVTSYLCAQYNCDDYRTVSDFKKSPQ